MRRYLLLFTVVYLVFTSYFHRNHAFSFHFVDEEDNFVLGKYLLSGKKLYSDLYSQHQPLPYILSAGVQQVSNPQSIYHLVIRHREFIILLSFFFSLILVWRFGWPGLAFVLIYEPLKPLLLGNVFLAESISIYPLLILTGMVVTGYNQTKINSIFIGFLFSWILFSLAPLWPLILFLGLFICYRSAQRIKFVIYFLAGCLPLLMLSLYFSSLGGYINSIFYLNPKYYLPTDPTRITFVTLLSSFAAPILSFISPYSASLAVIQICSLLLLRRLIYRRHFGNNQILSFFILGLANLRFITPGNQFYSGFHLLPWVSLLVFLTLLAYSKSKLLLLPLLISLVIYLPNLITIREPYQDYYINYSHQFDIGEAIRILASGISQNRTLVVPDESLIYWASHTQPATEFLFFYSWMEKIPYYTEKMSAQFRTQTPAYFYCECDDTSFFYPYLTQYRRITKFNQPTNLYLHHSQEDTISASALSQLEYYGFRL